MCHPLEIQQRFDPDHILISCLVSDTWTSTIAEMPSRKRNKGRERKARKAANDDRSNNDAGGLQPQQQRSDLTTLLSIISMEDRTICNHGYSDLLEDHICNVFMQEFEASVFSTIDGLVNKNIFFWLRCMIQSLNSLKTRKCTGYLMIWLTRKIY